MPRQVSHRRIGSICCYWASGTLATRLGCCSSFLPRQGEDRWSLMKSLKPRIQFHELCKFPKTWGSFLLIILWSLDRILSFFTGHIWKQTGILVLNWGYNLKRKLKICLPPLRNRSDYHLSKTEDTEHLRPSLTLILALLTTVSLSGKLVPHSRSSGNSTYPFYAHLSVSSLNYPFYFIFLG